MSYPSTISAVTEKLNTVAYAAESHLSEAAQQSLIEAAAHPSIVERCHKTIAALSPIFSADGDSMPLDVRELLAGACRLCNENSWKPRGGLSYASILASVIATLPVDDPVEEDPEAE